MPLIILLIQCYTVEILSTLADVKSALNSIKIRIRLNNKGSDNQAEGLFVKGRSKNSSNFRGRSSERDSGKGKSRG
jgi:hypothetical protein